MHHAPLISAVSLLIAKHLNQASLAEITEWLRYHAILNTGFAASEGGKLRLGKLHLEHLISALDEIDRRLDRLPLTEQDAHRSKHGRRRDEDEQVDLLFDDLSWVISLLKVQCIAEGFEEAVRRLDVCVEHLQSAAAKSNSPDGQGRRRNGADPLVSTGKEGRDCEPRVPCGPVKDADGRDSEFLAQTDMERTTNQESSSRGGEVTASQKQVGPVAFLGLNSFLTNSSRILASSSCKVAEESACCFPLRKGRDSHYCISG
jgi:hypothetical protein